jgi:MOSC domain-containing protein YiiM
LKTEPNIGSHSGNVNAASTTGRLEAILLRPARRTPVLSVTTCEVIAGEGLVGDHRPRHRGGERQVTLIQAEDMPVIASAMSIPTVDPKLLRRNLVVSGLPLLRLIGRQFRVGSVLLEATGECSPCARMSEALGVGAERAMSRRGGITAKVILGGTLSLGDLVVE